MQGCFLILNYKDSKVTQEAVSYLERLNGIKDCKIVIFDNGSESGSLEVLRSRYSCKDNVIVGGSKENLGFSEGNNAAYKLALEHCDRFDFVVSMNSDVMIHQPDFIDRINKYAREGTQAVVGPDVYNSRSKTHDNPLFLEIPSAEKMDQMIDEYEYKLDHFSDAAIRYKLSEMKARLKQSLPSWMVQVYRMIRGGDYYNSYESIQYGSVLHGCCLVFLRPYLEQEAVLFEPDTFLYGEEILLSIKCKTKGYRMLYDPSLHIEHREAVSGRADKKTDKGYEWQRLVNLIHAYNIVKECIEDNPWDTENKRNKEAEFV